MKLSTLFRAYVMTQQRLRQMAKLPKSQQWQAGLLEPRELRRSQKLRERTDKRIKDQERLQQWIADIGYCDDCGGPLQDRGFPEGRVCPICERDNRIAELQKERDELKAEVLDTLADMVRQNCEYYSVYKPEPRQYSHLFMSLYEDAIARLVKAGRMRDIGPGRFVFVADEVKQ